MSSNSKAIPDGSWVLVVGAASFVGSNIVQAFLKLGYKVRATDYSLPQASWMADDFFASYAADGHFELVIVPDIGEENAFDSVIKGVSAVIYVASVVTTFNPNDTIPLNIKGTLNALRAATREPSVSRFVVTSSYGAAFTPNPDPSVRLDANSWNDAAIARAWAPPPYTPDRYNSVYMASKAEQEKALWKFVKEEKPHFTVNTVLPSWICGRLLNETQNPSSAICVRMLYNGDATYLRSLGIYSYVNVRDVALIHVGAALDPEVANERIYAIARHTTWNDFLELMRKKYPEKHFIDDMPDLGRFSGTVDTSLGLKLLTKWGSQNGWTSLEEGLEETLDSVK
ncbi:hypothetical protein BP5796_12378 [Coleophoma crateriformis]|uniref:3-beta hydroxysteroid dehydrogenase/isomerase domain-containing protein n=1 Tax=Coleophoma crateriformis TaxID=565419 RepID=A0A3D8QA07_9HELO|nr:hypothetical protein BP5796_12378 [Coleophoma crateriformis]